MTTLTLETPFTTQLTQLIEILPSIKIEDSDLTPLKTSLNTAPLHLIELLAKLGTACRSLLVDNGYVCVRGLPLSSDVKTILTIGIELGEIFSDLSHQSTIVSEASPCLNAKLQGNQTEQLLMHTDFAMLTQPPVATIIQCRMSDPLGDEYGRNGIAVAQHIVSKYFGSEELELVVNTPMPFAGRTPAGEDIILKTPVLTLCANSLAKVRFHPSRIHHGFRTLGLKPNKDETRVLNTFQEMILSVRREMILRPGDILIVNNHTSLHDRTNCSIQLGIDGFKSRISHILFVQEFKD